MRAADIGVLVPTEHRVDGFQQLGAARLIDAARVNPYVVVAICESDFAEFLDLGEVFADFVIHK